MGEDVAQKPGVVPTDQSLLQVCLASTMQWKKSYAQIQHDNRHHLFLTIAGTTFQTLYDPGATVSVMSEASYYSIPEKHRRNYPR